MFIFLLSGFFFFLSKVTGCLFPLLGILIHEISLYKNHIPECLAEEITQSSYKQEEF